MALALVTGGTAGIGHAFAVELASRGWDLVLVARDSARLDAVAEELRTTYGRTVETITADLAVRDDLLRVAERVEDASSPIEMLVNNAGFGIHASLLDKDFSLQEKALDVMCLAVLVLSGAAGRAMSARGHGSIINIGSSSGIITTGNYSAVKAWVNTYTEGLANELRGTGVLVTAVLPGWVHTEFHERAGINASKLPEVVWLDADELVRDALDDNAHGKVLSIPSKRWSTAYWLGRHAPRPAIRWLSRKLSNSRKNP
ncbi:MAG TPA: SDR family NAD(P)-dependent oxidoreductase [Propionibacteriaceae bacterium]|nr:SDR family NAD(P)-dependent oxidoreductase [Propionibacteriaceae bacterium]